MIHRLETDTDEAWDGIMTLLADTDGLALVFDVEGHAVITWEAGEPEDGAERSVAVEPVEEEAPF